MRKKNKPVDFVESLDDRNECIKKRLSREIGEHRELLAKIPLIEEIAFKRGQIKATEDATKSLQEKSDD